MKKLVHFSTWILYKILYYFLPPDYYIKSKHKKINLSEWTDSSTKLNTRISVGIWILVIAVGIWIIL